MSQLIEVIKDFSNGEVIRQALGVKSGSGVTESVDALRILWNGKEYVLPTFAYWSVSYNTYASLGLVEGKIITLNGKQYKARMIKGSQQDVYADDNLVGTQNTEFYNFVAKHYQSIVPLANSQYILNYNVIMKEKIADGSKCLWCMANKVNGTITHGSTDVSASVSNLHFYPILEVHNSFTPRVQDLGEVSAPTQFTYDVIAQQDLTIHHVVGGKTIKVHNISKGTYALTFYLTQEVLDGLEYGKQECSVDIIRSWENWPQFKIPFYHMKPLTKPINDFNITKLLKHMSSIEGDIDYHKDRLRNIAEKVGVATLESDSLNLIISRLSKHVSSTVKRWASGTTLSSSSSTSFVSSGSNSSSTNYRNYLELPKLQFEPKTIIAVAQDQTVSINYTPVLFLTDIRGYNINTDIGGCGLYSGDGASSSFHTLTTKAKRDGNKVYIATTFSSPTTFKWIAFE